VCFLVRDVVKSLALDPTTNAELLKTMCGAAYWGVREAVVKALSQDLPTYGEAIKAMSGDAYWRVREAVVGALSQDIPTHIEVLKVMSDDASCEVRDAAREALEGFADDTRADPTATSTATAHSAEAAASEHPAASTPAPNKESDSDEDESEVQEEGQPPIIKMYAITGMVTTFFGLPRGASKYEKLEPAWVVENFTKKGYGSFTDKLREGGRKRLHGGKALRVPKGSSAGGVDLVEVSDSCVGGPVTLGFNGSLGPSVHFQGDKPYCASYGPASALRHVGFGHLADHLIDCADEILSADHQIAKVVELVAKSGGWTDTPAIKTFDPLSDRSPHVTIVQLCASDGDNTHVTAIAGDWLFDSNRQSALPLTAASLDMACVGKPTFSRVSYAVRLIPGKKLLKRIAMANALPVVKKARNV
jgi:hypothetical protein